ncbi:MAG: hypothetical protein LUH36_07185 [Oscillospiraceae bacterium]|nr:hypothetical protein [Oscillospiraceae bacterium]
MPRVAYGAAQRREQAEQRQRTRTMRMIFAAMAATGINRQDLARMAGMSYDVLCDCLRQTREFRLTEIIHVADALNMGDAERAALVGSKAKCRWEADNGAGK